MDGWSIPGTWSEINVWVQEATVAVGVVEPIELPDPGFVHGATSYGIPRHSAHLSPEPWAV